MHEGTIEGAVLDHVAHAVPRWPDVWARYAVDLGARWTSGGQGRGFAPAQLQFANGGRIEVLMPHDPHLNDFLQRFLSASGPGPHHITFKVPDLTIAVARARSAGIEPIGIDRSDPEWMEAFLHPRAATGVVVQMAEAYGTWSSPAPDDYPTTRRQRLDRTGELPAAAFTWIVHAVADLDSALALFVGLLGGQVVNSGERPDHAWVEVTWSGAPGLRLVAPTPGSPPGQLSEWLGARTGRIHHLEFVADEPSTITGAVPATKGLVGLDIDDADSRYWVIGRDSNAGLQLVISGR
jgi:methylmalonyl-CoA/ethylmalonyl-CoA epimerase